MFAYMQLLVINSPEYKTTDITNYMFESNGEFAPFDDPLIRTDDITTQEKVTNLNGLVEEQRGKSYAHRT
jgi:hypothetical protein